VNLIRILFLFILFVLVSLNGRSDTLKLSSWAVTNSSYSTPPRFEGPKNILHVLRENAPNPKLKPRFSEESRRFHDSVASLEHSIKTVFDLTSKPYEEVELELNYLQTFTEIWLNRVFIGKTDNAFRKWTFRINPSLLKNQNNELEITFYPPREHILHSGVLPFFSFPADNQTDSIKTAPFIRQPQQEFGWDFAFPELYMGFRVCPELHFTCNAGIRQIAVETIETDTLGAKLNAQIHVQNFGNKEIYVSAKGEFGATVRTRVLGSYIALSFEHKWPKLWWPRGYGDQPFYPITIYLTNSKNQIIDSLNSRYAVRTIRLIQETDSVGRSFYFEVNGKPIYMQGANVVMPNEPFEGERKSGLSNKELNFVLNANMNMLRIWGGGTYLPEAFFEWADTAGVLVWQDLMFACTYYPDSKAFESNIQEEIRQQVFRLIHHPSLALICGNNEIDVARKNWGWKEKYAYSPQVLNRLDSSYYRMFHRLIPESIQAVSDRVNYLPSSPVSNWGKEEDFAQGDNHDWGIWHGELPFDAISHRIPRFMSEYGFPSFPPVEVLEKYLGQMANAINPEQLVLSYKGLKLLRRYLDSKGYPHHSLEELVKSSHEVQRWHYAKMKRLLNNSSQRCMGDLWWQLNDVSAVMSWSLLDIDGNEKAHP
jgi:beta-mannosidase